LVRAQEESKSFPDKVGEWKYLSNRNTGNLFGLSSDQSRGFMAKVDAIASTWHETQVFNPPLGFEARARGEIRCDDGSCRGKPVQARLSAIFYYFVEGPDGRPSWGGEVNTSAELCINQPRHALSSKYSLWYEGLWLPDGREIAREPRATRQVAGFPLYDDELLLFSREGLPCWVPVSRAQFLEALIALREGEYAKQIAEIKAIADPYQTWVAERPARLARCEEACRQLQKSDPAKADELRAQFRKMEAAMEAGLKAAPAAIKPEALEPLRERNQRLRAERAALTPAELEQPAWYLPPDAYSSGLVPANTLNAQRLVTLNPSLFASTRPATDIQFISVRFLLEGLSPRNIGHQRLQAFLATADWQRVAAFIDTPRR
jgi:hypothetical protein